MMKTLAILIAFMIGAASVQATGNNKINRTHQNTEIQSVFGSDPLRIGGWGGLSTSISRVGDQDAILMGAKAGIIFNSSLSIGLAGYGLSGYMNNLYSGSLDEGRGAYLDAAYGGLFIEPSIASHLPVHISIPIIIGAGGAFYTKTDMYDWRKEYHENTDHLLDYSSFFVFEPGLELEVNLVKFVRLGLGISYRHTSGLRLIDTSDDILNNYSASFTLKLGVF